VLIKFRFLSLIYFYNYVVLLTITLSAVFIRQLSDCYFRPKDNDYSRLTKDWIWKGLIATQECIQRTALQSAQNCSCTAWTSSQLSARLHHPRCTDCSLTFFLWLYTCCMFCGLVSPFSAVILIYTSPGRFRRPNCILTGAMTAGFKRTYSESCDKVSNTTYNKQE